MVLWPRGMPDWSRLSPRRKAGSILPATISPRRVARNLCACPVVQGRIRGRLSAFIRHLWNRLAETFHDGGKIAFNLAPPVLLSGETSGRLRKREFDARPWRSILRLLAKGKRLRGTKLDHFGYSAERRAERQLIDHYEVLAAQVLESLSPANYEAELTLLRRADEVRSSVWSRTPRLLLISKVFPPPRAIPAISPKRGK